MPCRVEHAFDVFVQLFVLARIVETETAVAPNGGEAFSGQQLDVAQCDFADGKQRAEKEKVQGEDDDGFHQYRATVI